MLAAAVMNYDIFKSDLLQCCFTSVMLVVSVSADTLQSIVAWYYMCL